MTGINVCKLISTALLIILFTTFAYAESKEDLAKKSQNPVGNIISLPIEYWHYDGMANDSSVDALVIITGLSNRIREGYVDQSFNCPVSVS